VSEIRYVRTDEIKRAVSGRETEVLDALGIDWRSGRPHIQCPYPHHADNDPSWRWDQRRAHAICTCTAGGHADGIFDVVAKVERLEFEEAKIRVAELLHRADLIRTREGGNGQKLDAHSLLNARASLRDDRLPIIYLAHRLGIAEADVPRPTTRIVGLKLLGYYDPPTQKGEKPTLVGEFPCAVFGTVAADGRTHAHRIYLSPDGRAKADLGIGRDGKTRDPKKSAKLADRQPSIAGCAVIWGDPKKAKHLILFEGIENAAVGALAFRTEIEAAEVYIASAINAGGVEAFTPWPATTRVTIAADRDEAKEGSGYCRGEGAARRFALRNHEAVEVAIALPGAPGQSIDWLNILERDGVGAVRLGILEASPFFPTQEETDSSRQETYQGQRIKAVAEMYPLPALETLYLKYRPTLSGEIWVLKLAGGGGENEERWIPVASPFGVTALLCIADSEDAYGLRVLVQDMDGQPRAVDFDRAELARPHATEVHARLLKAGLRIQADGDSIVLKVLKAARPSNRIIVVSRPGWHWLPDPVFVTPAGEVIGAPDNVHLELAAGVKLPERVARSGTEEGSKAAITAAVTAENCPHWTLGAMASFAGVLVDLTQSETCGINESGDTSLGKTTSQQIGVSAWSSPNQSAGGLLKSMRATENALEVLARDSSGTLLALDETAHADGKVIGRMIYSLAADVGKSRMRPDSSLRRPYNWSTYLFLSGEKGLEQKVRDDGGQWTGGMAVRVPDVDVSGVNAAVAPHTIDAIKQIFVHYGHAGPAFVRALVASGLHREPDLLKGRITTTARALAGEGAHSAKLRAAIPFAFPAVGGALAQEFGILPREANVAGAVKWAWERFCDSADALALDPAQLAVVNIRQYIAERWDVTIKDVKALSGINNREAVGWYDQDTVYLPTNRIVAAAGGVLKEQRIVAALDQGGHLSRRGGLTRIAIRWVPKIGRVDCYALRRSQFGRTDNDVEPEQVRVVAGND